MPEDIAATLEQIRSNIRHLKQSLEREQLLLRQLRERCTHPQIQYWTNNDGDGQFTVERCLVCQQQVDGKLPRHPGQNIFFQWP